MEICSPSSPIQRAYNAQHVLVADRSMDMNDILDHFEADEHTIVDWRRFIQEQADYYIEQWQGIQAGRWWSFNINAFLFSILWLLYRQMIRTSLLVLGVFFFEGYLESLIFRSILSTDVLPWWTAIRVAVFSFLIGAWGNRLYLRYVTRQIRGIKEEYPPEEWVGMLHLRGGTSIFPVLLFLLLLLAAFLIGGMTTGFEHNPNIMF